MTTDGNVAVQTPEPVSAPVVTEPVQPVEQVKATEPVVEQPLTKEAVAKMVEEATQKVLTQAKEQGRRELQSAQDQNKAERIKAERRAKIMENTLESAQKRLAQVDPDAAKELELTTYREQAKGATVVEQEEQQKAAQEAFHTQFTTGLTQFISSLGLDPTDQRIDWAPTAPNYLEAQKRVLDSVAKIQKEKLQTVASLEKELKDLKAKANQTNKDNNSVSTSTSQGVVAGSDAEFIAKFASGDLPVTKANMDRYNKIKATY